MGQRLAPLENDLKRRGEVGRTTSPEPQMRAHTVVAFTLSVALLFASRGVAQGPTTSLQAGVTPLAGESIFELGARFSPRGSFGGDVSIDLYPEYFANDVLAGVVDFS